MMSIQQTISASGLFDGWQETMILSCLQGVMGTIYGNDATHPASAMAVLGDFCFLAGRPEIQLLHFLKNQLCPSFIIAVPQNSAWSALLSSFFGNAAVCVQRYATCKEPKVFDTAYLTRLSNEVPSGYTLVGIDASLFDACKHLEWCRDFVSNFPDYAAYQRWGAGCVMLHDGQIVSGASSYSAFYGGIEIEVDTREDYRRQGLACACCARLILNCLERGLYPSWDAQNLQSLALAEKLGYHYKESYIAYELRLK